MIRKFNPLTPPLDLVHSDSELNSAYLQVNNNLSDLTDASLARSNLGLGTAAIQDVGYFDLAGDASAVQTNLTTHIGLTGTAVHGLGSLSTLNTDTTDLTKYLLLTGGTLTGDLTTTALYTATINGGTLANDDITIQGTTNATRTSSSIYLQPNGGFVSIGGANPTRLLDVNVSLATYPSYLIATFRNTNSTNGNVKISIAGYSAETSLAFGVQNRTGGSILLQNLSATDGNYNAFGFLNATAQTVAGVFGVCTTQGAAGTTVGEVVFGVAQGASGFLQFFKVANGGAEVYSATGGLLTIKRVDTSATAGDNIGTLQWTNDDTQLTTQNVYANIVVTATSTVTTDAAAGTMKINVTGSTAGGSPIEHMQFAPTTVAKIGFFGVAAVVQPTAYTQTYSTASKTVPNDTAADLATTATTQTTPYGFATQAQGDNIATQFNLLRADVLALKKVVNALIDDGQALGLLS